MVARGDWRRALESIGSRPSASGYCAVLSACAKSVAREEAFRIALALPKVDAAPYNAAIRCQHWSSALKLLGCMQRRTAPDTITFNAAMKACQVRAAWPWVLDLYNSCPHPDVESMTLAIGALGLAGRWQDGLRLAKLGDQASNNAAMLSAARLGAWQASLRCWPHMLGKGWLPDKFTRTAAVAACAQAKPRRWRLALHLLRGGDAWTYNSIISLCPWPWAMRLFAHPPAGLKTDIVTANAAMAALARGGCWRSSLSILATVEPDAVSYGICTNVLMKAGRWRKAWLVVARALSVGRVSAESYNALVKDHWPRSLAVLAPKSEQQLVDESDLTSVWGWLLKTALITPELNRLN